MSPRGNPPDRDCITSTPPTDPTPLNFTSNFKIALTPPRLRLVGLIAGNEKPQNPTKIQESPLSCFSPHFVEKHAGQGHDRYLFSSENRIYPPCKRGVLPPSLTYPLHGSTGRSYALPLRSVLPAILRGVWGAFAPQFEMPESDINIE